MKHRVQLHALLCYVVVSKALACFMALWESARNLISSTTRINEDRIDLAGQNSSTDDADDSLIHNVVNESTSEILRAAFPEHWFLDCPRSPLI